MDEKALYKIGYGLYVLTAKDDNKDNGCIINTVMQVTAVPNRVAICVNKLNYTHDMIVNTGVFNISVIDNTATFELIKRFGFSSGKDTDKFDTYSEVKRSDNGLFYITECTNAYISAKVISTSDFDTHTIFVAEVTDSMIISDHNSVTYDYYHSKIKPKPDNAKKKGWRCKICGYIYEGEELPPDFICPICKHPASDFERIE